MRLTRESAWTRIAAVTVRFRTFHPQGMVKIGDTIFVSSVEVTVPAVRRAPRAGGPDRDAGAGVGHLFKMDGAGSLIAEARLGGGSIYHPGGMDFDGRHLWVAVAEYRPDSRSIVYRVDPETLKATEVLRVADHIGAVAFDTDDQTLHGVSWGSRRFYRWSVDAAGRAAGAGIPPAGQPALNPSHYIDYQDCKYAGGHRMLCTGVAELRQAASTPFRLGGIDVIDLRDLRALHQTPLVLWTDAGLPMAQNPVWIEPAANGLRGYFMPEDEVSTLYIYDVDLP